MTSCRRSRSRPRSCGRAVDQVWKNLAQFGAFAAIILAMGSVATERDRGTAAFILSKTRLARRVPGGQGRRHRLGPGPAVVLAVLVGWIYTAILFEPLPIVGWVAMAALAWLGLAAWAAITFLGSTVTGSAAAAAGVGFVALLVLSIARADPGRRPLSPRWAGRARHRARSGARWSLPTSSRPSSRRSS